MVCVLISTSHGAKATCMRFSDVPFSGLQSMVEVFRRRVIKLPKAAHRRVGAAEDRGYEPLSDGDEEVDIDAKKRAWPGFSRRSTSWIPSCVRNAVPR